MKYQTLKNNDDTIVAIATAVGQGGIGIVRLSGPQAITIADKIFVAKNKQSPHQFKNFMARYGWVVRDLGSVAEEIVDECLCVVMRGPKSYTAEDVVEINCHGGSAVMRVILQMALDAGARLADPGEFTKRAFLNGRIDLTQAEAVLDIIQAKTEAFARVSSHQLKGELSTQLEAMREILMKLYTEIEAIVNFPEDDVDARGRMRIVQEIKDVIQSISTLLDSADGGRLLRDGVNVVLCGKPNVGKSSLLNALLKQPRAIVSDIAGTTRDTIEETAQIEGIPIQLVDTAGILEPRDFIEEEAIKRSRMYIDGADLVLLILDGSRALENDDFQLMRQLQNRPVVVIVNKVDLPSIISDEEIIKQLPHKKIVRVSALMQVSLDDLRRALVASVTSSKTIDTHGVLINNLRHKEALKRAVEILQEAQELAEKNKSWEFVSEDIKTAVHELDTITGRDIDADLLDQIFSRFCIGK